MIDIEIQNVVAYKICEKRRIQTCTCLNPSFLCLGISFKAEVLCEKLFYAHSDCIVLAVCKEIFREMFAA